MAQKPQKPRQDFPLFPHSGGVWAKKIKGKLRYFGPWSDPDGALKRFLAERDYYQAGVEPPAKIITVATLLNGFLGGKDALLKTDDITKATYKDYERVCDVIAEFFGKDRPAETIQPEEFAELRVKLSGCSPYTLKRRLTMARMVFAYGTEELGLSLRFKRSLKEPSKKKIRQRKKAREKRLYDAADLRAMVEAAEPHLKAMILLGINCGFGSTDCVKLPADAISGGWHNFARTKNEVERRCPLWPETQKAIAALQTSDHVFNGRYWDRHVVAREFGELCEKCKIKNHGFYSLRRTFETKATTAKVSQAAINYVMGHEGRGMDDVYRQEIYDSELVECVEHVRKWYLGIINIA